MPAFKYSQKLFLLFLVIIVAGVLFVRTFKRPSDKLIFNDNKTMKITSPAFENNENIPSKYTCDGENASPPLEFSEIPENTKSLAFILDDPDAPVTGGFVHWVLWNISPETKSITEKSVPAEAVSGTNSSDKTGYIGPCPPSGTHHYQFKLYALDTALSLEPSATREDVEKAIEGHILDQALLVGLYQRQR